jgi:large subunit ribosomal protein L21
MKYAVIKTGGKQYIVREGDVIRVERLKEKKPGDIVRFEEVLFYKDDGKVQIGTPIIQGAFVSAEVIKEGKGEKVIAFRYKPKKRVSVKRGHRQIYTEVKIKEIKV